MEYELEVFEVYDDFEPTTTKTKRHKKHTRKKHKRKRSVVSAPDDIEDAEAIRGPRTGAVADESRRECGTGLRHILATLFGKVFSSGAQNRYQTSSSLPECLDVPQSPISRCRNCVQYGKFYMHRICVFIQSPQIFLSNLHYSFKAHLQMVVMTSKSKSRRPFAN